MSNIQNRNADMYLTQDLLKRKRARNELIRRLKSAGITLASLTVLFVFLLPLVYGVVGSLKSDNQISSPRAPLVIPSSQRKYTYKGKEYDILKVPTNDGIKEWAIVEKSPDYSMFIDPKNPEAGEIKWEGKWITLDNVWYTDFKWINYVDAWNKIRFERLLFNTAMYAILSTFGAVMSAAIVAYGFARFRFKQKGFLFMIVMATIILPPAVTLIPTYFVFFKIGWINTWLPLIIPAYFANGYNIFLLRQFYLGIPREMDEAAKIDGAGPIKTFLLVILPQALPALTAVTLFHFFFCWNDFFGPLIYLISARDLHPIQVGLTQFNQLYTQKTNWIMSASITSSVIPLVIFFFAQKFFMQGVVITGVEK
ncbi:MAG: carbohydrate ABC transporter permease [Spirochaetales bacterium]|nr:carbohydrate ABC transporter permease [Spirochaetales bacterium]